MVMIIIGLVGALAGSVGTRNPILVVIAAGLVYGLYKLSKSNMGQNEKQEMALKMEEYERTWYCSKCATKFIW
jgi:hypothetical protein